jgi:hypothetical protein
MKLSIGQFYGLLRNVGKKNNQPAISEGLDKFGRKYSLVKDIKDGKMDSLDFMEVRMALEEQLGELKGIGADKYEIADKVADGSNDVGELYVGICQTEGIEPDYSDEPPLALAAAAA